MPKDELQAAFDTDQNRYKNARASLSIKKMTNTTMHQLDDRHLGIIDINGVASVVGAGAATWGVSMDCASGFAAELSTFDVCGAGSAFGGIAGFSTGSLARRHKSMAGG